MKKFFIWYIAVFLVILALLLSLQYYLNNGISSSVSEISAKDIFGAENITNKSKPADIKPKDIGNVNTNYTANYKNVSNEYNGKNATSSLKVDDIVEVQFFMKDGYDLIGSRSGIIADNVYYYSNKLEDIVNLLNNSETRKARKENNMTYDYYSGVVFVLKNSSFVFRNVFITRSELENIRSIFQHKDIVLSDTARLGSTYVKMYDDMTDEELKAVITALQGVQPIYQDFADDHSSPGSSHSIVENHIFAYQYENGREIVYCYDANSSQELINAMDKYYSRKTKSILDEDVSTGFGIMMLYEDNRPIDSYIFASSQETLLKYVRNHFSENYPKDDFAQVFSSYGNYEYTYVKLELTDELQELIKNLRYSK